MATYSEKLKSPKWQKKRLAVLERDNWTCQDCGATEKNLHVHHKAYIFGKEIWDYPNSNFKTLCEKCHDKTTKLKKDIKNIIDEHCDVELLEYAYYILSSIANYLPHLRKKAIKQTTKIFDDINIPF